MIRAMFKKQMMEIFQNYYYNRKKGIAYSRKEGAVRVLFYVLFVLFIFGLLFSSIGGGIIGPCIEAGQVWLYFAIYTGVAVLLGLFGSVFSTYAELYLAKDNDLILSLPVPVGVIMSTRLLSVYLMGLLYSSGALISCEIIYAQHVAFSVSALLGGIFLFLLVSIFVLVLSCLLGYIVARISRKLKRQGVIAAVIGVVALAVYYYFFAKAQTLVNQLVENVAGYGNELPVGARVFALIGGIGEGKPVSILVCTAVCLVLFLILWAIMRRSFIAITTAADGTKRKVYHETMAKQKTPTVAVSEKERRKLLSSASYLLNCGLGIVLLPAAGIFLLVQRTTILDVLWSAAEEGVDMRAMLVFVVTLIASTICIVTPSVSLEGNNIWILQTLPINPEEVLKGKLKNHLLFALVPTIFCLICAVIVAGTDALTSVLMALFAILNVWLLGLVGLFLGLRHANVHWSNENQPIKQNISILLSLLAGVLFSVVLGGVFFALSPFLGAKGCLLLFILLEILLILPLKRWMKRRGTEIFMSL